MTEEAYNQRRAELADTFENARKSKGLTYQDLANLLGKKDKSNVAKEVKSMNIKLKTLLEYSEALNLEVIVRPKE